MGQHRMPLVLDLDPQIVENVTVGENPSISTWRLRRGCRRPVAARQDQNQVGTSNFFKVHLVSFFAFFF
jgi:hypothetical protein